MSDCDGKPKEFTPKVVDEANRELDVIRASNPDIVEDIPMIEFMNQDRSRYFQFIADTLVYAADLDDEGMIVESTLSLIHI